MAATAPSESSPRQAAKNPSCRFQRATRKSQIDQLISMRLRNLNGENPTLVPKSRCEQRTAQTRSCLGVQGLGQRETNQNAPRPPETWRNHFEQGISKAIEIRGVRGQALEVQNHFEQRISKTMANLYAKSLRLTPTARATQRYVSTRRSPTLQSPMREATSPCTQRPRQIRRKKSS